MSIWLRSWGVSLRLAWRELRRSKGRSALVVLLIGAPIAALAFIAVSYDTFTLTPQERHVRQFGTADAIATWISNKPLPIDAGDNSVQPPKAVDADLLALLPSGSQVARVAMGGGVTRVHTATGIGALTTYYAPVDSPLTQGIFTIRRGAAPHGDGEIALTEQAIDRLGTGLGGTVTTVRPDKAYKVTAIVEVPADLSAALILPPQAMPEQDPVGRSWLIKVPGGITPQITDHLAHHGVSVGDPMADTAPSSSAREQFQLSIVVVGLIAFEVILLCGPAFAVGARRRRRDLALVAANGGTARQLRRIVLADGLVLGVVGSLVGLLLGTPVAVAARPLIETLIVHRRSGELRFLPIALAAGVVLAAATGVLAALMPAITASRQNVVAALAGRRGITRSRKRWVVVGLVLLGLATVVAVLGAANVNADIILPGLVLGQLALVVLTPSIIGLLGRLGRALPLAPRIALRDTARNRSSAAPAISAVMAVVAGSVMLGVYYTSGHANDNMRYRPAMHLGYVAIGLTSSGPTGQAEMPVGDQALLKTKLQQALPVDHFFTIGSPACHGPGVKPENPCGLNIRVPAVNQCPWSGENVPTGAERERAAADPRCRTGAVYAGMTDTVVDDGANLAALTGADPTDAEAAVVVLRAGGVVVTDPRLVVDGKATLESFDGTKPPQTGSDPMVGQMRELPAYALHSGSLGMAFAIAPQTLTRLGFADGPGVLIVATTRMPTTAEQDQLNEVMTGYTDGTFAYVEQGWTSDDTLMLLILAFASAVVTLAATAVVTGLAAADGRADLATLGAVGAAPRVRRFVALSQSGVIAGLGTALGIAAGIGAAFVLIAAVNRHAAMANWPIEPPMPLAVPWRQLGVVVVVPIVAMLGAGLLTRSRLPIERRA